MTESEADGGTDNSEQSETEYTIDVNDTRYELNKEFRAMIQERAHSEYKENDFFSCWWKIANPDDYSDEEWDENNHEAGDPILVIETRGPIVPWDQIDELEFEMQDISEQADDDDADYHEDEIDEGNGMKTIDPDSVEQEDDVDEEDEDMERTHFPMTPQKYEEIPSPDGEEPDKLPPKPISMDDDPALVWWIPRHPDIEERWSAGEAITKSSSWVEWNVQARADEIAPDPDGEDKPTSHDRFESMLKHCDCSKLAEVSTNQNTPSDDEPSGQVERKGEDSFENGRYGGNNFHV